jgi:heme exporter protein C
VELEVGHIGLLGDRKVQLLELQQQETLVTARVKVSEPGLSSETVLEPTFNLATAEPEHLPQIPGVKFRLSLQAVDSEAGTGLINIEAPGTGLLNNQRTLITFLASIIGFTGLFVWMFHIRVILLGVQWDLARRDGMVA